MKSLQQQVKTTAISESDSLLLGQVKSNIGSSRSSARAMHELQVLLQKEPNEPTKEVQNLYDLMATQTNISSTVSPCETRDEQNEPNMYSTL